MPIMWPQPLGQKSNKHKWMKKFKFRIQKHFIRKANFKFIWLIYIFVVIHIIIYFMSYLFIQSWPFRRSICMYLLFIIATFLIFSVNHCAQVWYPIYNNEVLVYLILIHDNVDRYTSCDTSLARYLSSPPEPAWICFSSFCGGWGGIFAASVALGVLSGGFGLRLWSKLWGPDHCSLLDVWMCFWDSLRELWTWFRISMHIQIPKCLSRGFF